MKKLPFLISLLVVMAITSQHHNQFKHNLFQYTGIYTFGKQNQLNKTFTYLQETLTEIGNITFNTTPVTQYSIYNTKPTFYYLSSQQKAQIIGNDTIIIFGSRVEATISFQWSKNAIGPTTYGRGTAVGLSDQTPFAVYMSFDSNNNIRFELLDYIDISWSENQFELTRILPSDTATEDQQIISKMLNNIYGFTTIKNLLEKQLSKTYSYYLRTSLYQIDYQFDYIWNPGNNQDSTSISMKRKIINFDVQKSEIYILSDIRAQFAKEWKQQTRSIPRIALYPKLYGDTQQFISLTFYENMIRYAISNNILDSDLDPKLWKSAMFRFFAGDIYPIFPLLQSRFLANDPVDGKCSAIQDGLKVEKSTFYTFNVSIQFNCSLEIHRKKIVDFNLKLKLEISGKPNQNSIDFLLKNYQQQTKFYPFEDYTMQNTKKASQMLHLSLNKLFQRKLFGSGFPISPSKDYPIFFAEDNYTGIYDPTRINPDQYTSDTMTSKKEKQKKITIKNLI